MIVMTCLFIKNLFTLLLLLSLYSTLTLCTSTRSPTHTPIHLLTPPPHTHTHKQALIVCSAAESVMQTWPFDTPAYRAVGRQAVWTSETWPSPLIAPPPIPVTVRAPLTFYTGTLSLISSHVCQANSMKCISFGCYGTTSQLNCVASGKDKAASPSSVGEGQGGFVAEVLLH